MRKKYILSHQVEQSEQLLGRLMRAAGLSRDRQEMSNRLIGLGDFTSAEAIKSAAPLLAISDFQEFRESAEVLFSRLQSESVFDAALPDMIAAELRANILTGDAILLYEVEEAEPIPFARTDFAGFGELLPLKVAALIAFTSEFLRGLKPETDMTLNNSFLRAVAAATDAALIRRLSENAGTSTPATGDFAEDIKNAAGIILGGGTGRLHLVISPATALQFAFATAADGAFLFPSFDANTGGVIGGIQAHVSDQIGDDSSGGRALLFDASRIAANKGSIDIQRSENASVQMRSDPENEHSTVVSSFQSNSVFLRILRTFGLKLPDAKISVEFSNVGNWFGEA